MSKESGNKDYIVKAKFTDDGEILLSPIENSGKGKSRRKEKGIAVSDPDLFELLVSLGYGSLVYDVVNKYRGKNRYRKVYMFERNYVVQETVSTYHHMKKQNPNYRFKKKIRPLMHIDDANISGGFKKKFLAVGNNVGLDNAKAGEVLAVCFDRLDRIDQFGNYYHMTEDKYKMTNNDIGGVQLVEEYVVRHPYVILNELIEVIASETNGEVVTTLCKVVATERFADQLLCIAKNWKSYFDLFTPL